MVTDVTLSSLMNLFALFGSRANIDVDRAKRVITDYLTRHYGVRNVDDYIGLFDDLLSLYSMSEDLDKESIVSGIVTNLNGAISASEEPLILLRLMELCSMAENFDADDDIFQMVSSRFDLPDSILVEFRHYVKNESSDAVKIQRFEGLDGFIKTLQLRDFNLLLFSYHGEDRILLNDVPITADLFQVWEQSGIVKCPHRQPLYFTSVMEAYGTRRSDEQVEFCARDLNFRFPNSDNGMHDFSFTLHSGELLAIMGGSGAGKTTLLTLLNGSLKPDSGSITINGHDISEEQSKSLIGFVPQDDLLIEELTVFQNLYYTARLCFDGMSEFELRKKVLTCLKELGLEAAKDLKVGSPINKYISGGQRKRLNIALELIREPAVLFLDEPTSGLSSSDTERVILLLKQQTYRGKLIIVNIHQPSSDVFKLFDRLWLLDRGGYPVFDGNPIEAVTYFKTAANYADADASMCPVCGNVNPEVVLNIIDEKALNQAGLETDERKVKPQEWHKMYLEQRPSFEPAQISEVPRSEQRKPGAFQQFLIQFQRNFQTKITNLQWLLITLLEAPLLAIICGLLTRYAPESGYTIMDNKNLVTFMFMAVIVAIFIGMSGSAEEIIRDRALLKREKFLQLSYASYISSKVVLSALVSLLQTFLFVAVGHLVLGYHDLFLVWWLILFASAFVANMTGLLLSQCLSSVVAIYITIPLLLIPQILLCGLVVDFNDLDAKSTTGNVPVIGNVIPSRWAYEALAVTAFTDNDYEQNFFELEQQKYEWQYYRASFLYELQSQLETMEHERSKGEEVKPEHLDIIRINLPVVTEVTGAQSYQGDYDYASLKAYMAELEGILSRAGNKVTLRHDRVVTQMRDEMGTEAYRNFRRSHYNSKLEEVVLNLGSRSAQDIVYNHIVPRVGTVFLRPRSTNGGAPFYSHVKNLGSAEIPTLWFNLGILLLMSLLCSLLLYTDCPGKYIRKERN